MSSNPIRRVRACALCVVENRLLMVRLEDPETKRQFLFPPGGMVEPGELPARAAERETLEETGYRVRVDERSESLLDYPFKWGKLEYDCTTYFYRAVLADGDAPGPVTDLEFHRGVVWLPVERVEKEFAFHPQLHAAVRRLLGI